LTSDNRLFDVKNVVVKNIKVACHPIFQTLVPCRTPEVGYQAGKKKKPVFLSRHLQYVFLQREELPRMIKALESDSPLERLFGSAYNKYFRKSWLFPW